MIIHHINSVGPIINTMFIQNNKDGDLVGYMDINENQRLTLEVFTNQHGIKLHRFVIADQQVLEISNTVDVTAVKDAILAFFGTEEAGKKLSNEVTISFCRILFDSLLDFHREEYLKSLDENFGN